MLCLDFQDPICFPHQSISILLRNEKVMIKLLYGTDQDQRFRQSAPAPAPLHRHIQSSYSSPETDRIYSTIKDCLAGDGISRQELYIIFRGQMSSSKVDEGLETLANEGHIYTTLNENYFKSIES